MMIIFGRRYSCRVTRLLSFLASNDRFGSKNAPSVGSKGVPLASRIRFTREDAFGAFRHYQLGTAPLLFSNILLLYVSGTAQLHVVSCRSHGTRRTRPCLLLLPTTPPYAYGVLDKRSVHDIRRPKSQARFSPGVNNLLGVSVTIWSL